MVELWTDGAAIRPGGQKGMVPGGWAAIVRIDTGMADERGDALISEHVVSGRSHASEANRMELTAVLEGLRSLGQPPTNVTVFTDNNNVKNWVEGHYKINHSDIFELVDAIRSTGHRITFRKVKAHAGVPHNERADGLANQQARQAVREVQGE